jgi:hypothetical protein
LLQTGEILGAVFPMLQSARLDVAPANQPCGYAGQPRDRDRINDANLYLLRAHRIENSSDYPKLMCSPTC